MCREDNQYIWRRKEQKWGLETREVKAEGKAVKRLCGWNLTAKNALESQRICFWATLAK